MLFYKLSHLSAKKCTVNGILTLYLNSCNKKLSSYETLLKFIMVHTGDPIHKEN